MGRYAEAKEFIIDKIKSGLPGTLYYHGLHHVMDVLAAAERYGELENITDNEMELLRLAALFHDSGFVISPKEHEQTGCRFAKENLPAFGYSEKEIQTVCGMIMATRFPHHPHNLLEQIICDADLDYLGRDDFFEIGNTLFEELKRQGTIKDENDWNKLQENFLTTHNYFTKSAITLRQAKKEEHLAKIRLSLKKVKI